ncbi:MAG: hypothetical protein ACO1PN_09465 [Betaproteobacteria bacterium]
MPIRRLQPVSRHVLPVTSPWQVLGLGAALGRTPGWIQLRGVRYAASAVIAAVGIYGMLHVLQPAAIQSDSLLCRVAPKLAGLLR